MVSIRENRIAAVSLLASSLAVIVAIGPWVHDRYAVIESRIFDRPLEPAAIQLIANSDRFDGALISIVGSCVIRFEHNAVLGSADPASWLSGVWLELDQEQKRNLESLSPRSCRVTGIFRDGPAGHMARWPAGLNPVKEVVFYEGVSSTGENASRRRPAQPDEKL